MTLAGLRLMQFGTQLGKGPVVAGLLLAVAVQGATAQSTPTGALRREQLKRGDPTNPAPYRCAPVPTPAAPTSAQRLQARDLARRGQQSAILGDRASARDQLRQAAALDPTDADLAYQLARANDAADDAAAAVREYCRFLAISPNAPEAAETRERIATLGRPLQLATSQPALAAFQAGLAAYERGDLASAETQFRTAITRQPSWAEAYYDRGVVLLARGDQQRALADFEQYLRLKPEAEDRVAVVARVNSLRTPPRSPSTALSLGLVIPGAGQFYTGRPVGGVFALAGAGAAVAYALTSSTRPVTEQRQGTDPFGKPYTFSETHIVTERPHMALGLAGAGAIAIGSAIEAYHHAGATSQPPRRVSLSLMPGVDVLAVRATIR